MNKNNKFAVLYTKATGPNKTSDYIIQISFGFYELDENTKTFNKEKEETFNIRPKTDNFEVSEYSLSNYGLTKDMILQHTTLLKDLHETIQNILNEYTIITFNGLNFDIQFLYNNFLEYGIELDFSNSSVIDTHKIELTLNPTNLEGVFSKYNNYNTTVENLYNTTGLQDDLTILDQTIIIYQYQLSNPNYESMNFDFAVLSPEGFIYKKGENIYISVGKHKDKDVFEIYNTDLSYLQWVYKHASNITKTNIVNYIKKIKNS